MPTPGKTAGAAPQTLRLLAGLLASPGGDSLEVLRELALANAWLAAPLAELEGLPLDEWQAEHTRLFVCGHPKTVCPPFESVFVGGAMFGEASQQIDDLYRRAGLEAEGAPPDYLGTMMECAAWLTEQPCTHGGALLDELWREHLSAWVPRFAATLAEESRLGLYRALGIQLGALFHD